MNHEESRIQAAIVTEYRKRGVFVHSCPNDFVKDARSMGTAVTMGLFPGVADLVAWLPSGITYIEVKTATGKLSPAQERFRDRCKSSGIPYFVVRSLDDALKLL